MQARPAKWRAVQWESIVCIVGNAEKAWTHSADATLLGGVW